MHSKGIFVGTIRISSVLESQQVHVFWSGIDVVISDMPDGKYPKREIFLRPFSPKMFRQLSSSAEMMQGVTYTISGNKVGSYFHKHSGPPEGDSDLWPIKEFTVNAKFTRSHLTLEINGVTGKSENNSYDGDNSGLSPINFEVNFQVPRSEMVNFLQVPEGPNRYFEERVDGCE